MKPRSPIVTASDIADVVSSVGHHKRRCILESVGADFLRLYPKGELSLQAVLAMKEKYRTEGKRSKFLNFKGLLSLLFHRGYIERNPAHGIPNNVFPKRVRPVITDADWQRLLDGSRNHWLYPAFLGQRMTGMAIADVCLLEWKHVDVDKGIITKVRQKMVTREGRPCLIPLDPDGPYLAFLRERHKFKDEFPNIGVYPSVNGAHYVDNHLAKMVLRSDSRGVIRAWQDLAKKLGLGHLKTHDFRANTATALVKAVGPIYAAQVTGHTDLNQLMEYVQPDPDILKEKLYPAKV